jgi:hypothetical protein
MSKSAELMGDALDITMEMILENIESVPEGEVKLRHSVHAIVAAALPFVKLAAKKRDRRHTPEEKAIVIEAFLIAMRYYSTLTGMQGITSLDLRHPVVQ